MKIDRLNSKINRSHALFVLTLASISLFSILVFHSRIDVSAMNTRRPPVPCRRGKLEWMPVIDDKWDALHAENIYMRNLENRGRVFNNGTANLDFGKLVKHSLVPSNNSLPNLADILEYYAPNYPCFGAERMGRWIHGGRWLCKPRLFSNLTVVYSIGHHGEITFESDIYLTTEARIHVFADLNPELAEMMANHVEFTYHQANISTVTNKKLKLITFKDMMRSLQHTYVDVVKLDCDGCEYEILDVLLKLPGIYIGQLVVTMNNVRKRVNELSRILKAMEDKDYRMFHMETSWRVAGAIHLSYIHISALTFS